MAILTAYLQYDIDAFHLKSYINQFESHLLERNVNNPWEDNYTVFTSDLAIELLGSGFGYGGRADMIKGDVEGLSEWFWDDFLLEWTEIYNLTDAVEVSSQAFYDAFRTSKTSDDFGLISTMLSGNDRFNLSGDNDRANGFDGNDKMFGYDGNDVLKGGDGKDKLYGGNGRDTLRGGDGNDVIRGGAGRDKEIGGAGADIFRFRTGDDKSIIKDFVSKGAESDVIDLSGLASVTKWRDLQNNHMEQDGADVRIDGGDGDIIIIRNMDLDDLNKADFIF